MIPSEFALAAFLLGLCLGVIAMVFLDQAEPPKGGMR